LSFGSARSSSSANCDALPTSVSDSNGVGGAGCAGSPSGRV
jgi:hypothetical protein